MAHDAAVRQKYLNVLHMLQKGDPTDPVLSGDECSVQDELITPRVLQLRPVSTVTAIHQEIGRLRSNQIFVTFSQKIQEVIIDDTRYFSDIVGTLLKALS